MLPHGGSSGRGSPRIDPPPRCCTRPITNEVCRSRPAAAHAIDPCGSTRPSKRARRDDQRSNPARSKCDDPSSPRFRIRSEQRNPNNQPTLNSEAPKEFRWATQMFSSLWPWFHPGLCRVSAPEPGDPHHQAKPETRMPYSRALGRDRTRSPVHSGEVNHLSLSWHGPGQAAPPLAGTRDHSGRHADPS